MHTCMYACMHALLHGQRRRKCHALPRGAVPTCHPLNVEKQTGKLSLHWSWWQPLRFVFPVFISLRSTEAQRSSTADPEPQSKAQRRLQPPCAISLIILLLRKIQGELHHDIHADSESKANVHLAHKGAFGLARAASRNMG